MVLASDENTINHYRVNWDLMHTVDRTQTIVTHHSGHPRVWNGHRDGGAALDSNHDDEYANLAKPLGGYGERVEDPEEIVPAICRAREAMASGGPALLEFMNQGGKYPFTPAS